LFGSRRALIWRTPTCFWKFGPRAKPRLRLLFADEVRPCSIYGRLFWRLGNRRHLAFNIFDAVSPHTVAGGYTRPIYTPHKTLPLSTRVTQQSRREMGSAPGWGKMVALMAAEVRPSG
jgi:hypothetical protein